MKSWCYQSLWQEENGQYHRNPLWCATEAKNGEYKDQMKTICGRVIILTVGIERRNPTCPDCIKKLKKRNK